jgi:hypothetical protein
MPYIATVTEVVVAETVAGLDGDAMGREVGLSVRVIFRPEILNGRDRHAATNRPAR